MSDSVRDSFSVEPGPRGGYWVRCHVCNKVSKAWDRRSNALMIGYQHTIGEHTHPWNAGWVDE